MKLLFDQNLAPRLVDTLDYLFPESRQAKMIWIRIGNASVEEIETVLRSHVEALEQFVADAEAAYLILS